MNPTIDNPNFLEELYYKKEYYLNKKTKDNIPDCDRTIEKFELQTQQKLIENYINPNTPYNNLLVMWGTGVGKTLGAITIAENFRNYIKGIRQKTDSKPFIYVISSDAAKNNFIKELFSEFVKEPYITIKERSRLAELSKLSDTKEGESRYNLYFKELETRLTNPAMGGYYKFMGYEVFKNRSLGSKTRLDSKKFAKTMKGEYRRTKGIKTINNMNDSILIIDEAHKIEGLDWGKSVELMIERSKNLRIILLTATPMMDKPLEIIQMLNFLLPKNKKIKRSEVFKVTKDQKTNIYNVTDQGLKIIGERSRGYVTYLRGINPYTFPKRIEEGEVITKFGFKYTKLIQCFMPKLQLDTYNKEFANKKPTHISDDRHLLDIVFPNPMNDKYGIFKTVDINNLKYANIDWLKKVGIQILIDPINRKNIIITGNILKKENIKKYSNKYYKIINNILDTLRSDSGCILIYNEFITGIGLKLFQQVLIMNGFEEYDLMQTINYNRNNYNKNTLCVWCGNPSHKHNSKDHKFIPAKIIILYGEISRIQRKKIIDLINMYENKNGEIIKCVLGSSVISESIDFKRLREVHIINFQKNIPTIEQIVGRAIRHCSHVGLPQKQRQVKIFKYVSSIPNSKEPSIEEKIYLRSENKHIIVKRIERQLKINAIDCVNNKAENIFDEEVKEFSGCETSKNPNKMCSPLCDYQDCYFKCAWEPKKNIDIHNRIDTSSFDAYFYQDEIQRISKLIRQMFSNNIVFTYEDFKKAAEENIKLFDDKYLDVALNNLIKEKTAILNQYNYAGYIIYRKPYYIFQPFDNANESISLVKRLIPYNVYMKREIPLKKYIETKRDIKQEVSAKNIVADIKKLHNIPKIGKLLSKLDLKVQQQILEDAIRDNFNNTGDKKYIKNILKYYKKYLLTNKQLERSNFLTGSESLSSERTSDELIVGQLLSKRPRCMTDTGWEYCVRDYTKKIKPLKENNIIIGFIDKNKSNKMIFKLRKSLKKQKDYADRRKRERGYVCNQSNDKSIIHKIASELNINTKNISIAILCEKIELELRKRELEQRDNVKWFYEYLELI